MPASFPTSIKTFATRSDNVDTVFAAHVNELQEEVAAVEAELGTNPSDSTVRSTNYSTVDARLEALETDYSLGSHTHGGYIAASLLTTNGDIIVREGGVPARKGLGTARQVLRTNAAGDGVEYASATVVFYTSHTWAIPNPSATMEIGRHKIKKHANQTIKLVSVTDAVIGGTSVTYDLEVNGSAITGGSGLSATTTDNESDFADVTLADADLIAPDPTAVTGTVTMWVVTITLEHTVAVV